MHIASEPAQSSGASLLRQWGVTASPGSRPSPLVFPVATQWTDEGTCVLVDRSQPENRIIEVDAAGVVRWTFRRPPRMNWAYRLDAGTVLCTLADGLYRVDSRGRCELLCGLPLSSPPNAASVLGRTVAVGSDDGIDLVSLDGRHLRRHRPSERTFLEPADVQLLPDGHVLIADASAACVVELDAEGRRVRMFGRWRQPGLREDRLSVPLSACRLRDGSTLVADWRTHQVLRFDPDGSRAGSLPTPGRAALFAPSSVRETASGHLLVGETGNRRVSLRDAAGRVLWEYGPDSLPKRTLSFPRSVQPLPPAAAAGASRDREADREADGDLLVCDSYSDRVVVLGPAGQPRWSFGRAAESGDGDGLDIPRSATRHFGTTCVCDGLNGRVLLVGLDGRVSREIRRVVLDGRSIALGDPHHAYLVSEGYVCVVDSDLDAVFLLDPDDRAVAQWGYGSGLLADPHYARVLPDGGLIVANSGRNRIVEMDRVGAIRWQLAATVAAGGDRRQTLRYPRFGDLLPDGSVLVVDTDNCRVVRTDRAGRELWSAGPVLPDRADAAMPPELRVAKWAALDRRGRLLVADYYNSRIVLLAPIPSWPRAALRRAVGALSPV